MYAQNSNGTWQELHGNVVFSPTVYQTAESLSDEQRAEFGVYLIADQPKPDISREQKYGKPEYRISGTSVERSYPVEPKSQEEIDADSKAKAASVRAERNALLSASDWTQVADAPVDQQAWAAYRQALRDLTKQEGFPFTVVWPQEP